MSEIRVCQKWPIPSDAFGLRADLYLQRKMGRISRNRAQKIILNQDFLLNNQPIKSSQKVKVGEMACLWRFAPDEPDSIKDFNVEVIYEHKDFLVLNKPHGLNIHPSAKSLYKTLTFWLKVNYPNFKINPSHRLDKDTSGVVICSKNKVTDALLKKQFLKKQVKKIYLAVVQGHFKSSKVIDMPIATQENGLRIRMVHDKNGKKAITKVRAVKYCSETHRTLVLCRPLTGRQHQIRSHLALIGFPIVGDKLYGKSDSFFKAICAKEPQAWALLEHERHALHAFKLMITINEKKYIFRADIPKDFYRLKLFAKPSC